jgi:hypothetical protein
MGGIRGLVSGVRATVEAEKLRFLAPPYFFTS